VQWAGDAAARWADARSPRIQANAALCRAALTERACILLAGGAIVVGTRDRRKEHLMKLTNDLVQRTVSQFEAQTIPDSHPALPQLSELFGDHTFFLDNNGLHIVEPAEATKRGVQSGRVVKLASWSDASHTSLSPHRPEATDIVVTFGTEH
jgi:hypothetical protein